MALDERVQLISKLRTRIKRFNDERVNYVKPFFNAENAHFFYRARDISEGFKDSHHISTTCTCTILLSKWGDLSKVVNDIEKLKSTILENKWKTAKLGINNPYTVSFVLNALNELNVPASTPKVNSGIEKLIKKIKEGEGGISLAPKDEGTKSAFVTFWALKALDCFREDFKNKNKIAKIDGAIKLAVEWSIREVYRQLSYFSADNSDLKNIHQLAFAWASCRRPGHHPALPKEISDLVLSTIFNVQEESGIWKKYYPLFNWGVAGSAYVYHFELLMALISAVEGDSLCLLPYLEKISKVLDWVESRIITTRIDELTSIAGWSIDSDPSVRFQPISWATIEVLYVLSKIDEFLVDLHRHLIIRLLDHDSSTAHIQDDTKTDMVDINIPEETTTVLEVVRKSIILPIKQVNSSLYYNRPENVCLSAFLFGPPGTSKTSLAQMIASQLGWPLLEIDPSHFVPRTDAGLEMRVLEVFSYLENLCDTVILLDEMDELFRTRDDGDRIGRLWTTLMLPRLNKLRKKSRSVIIGATNYIEKIDEAARRAGRFDIVVPVGPPESKGKLRLLAKMKGGDQGIAEGWLDNIRPEENETLERVLFNEIKLLSEEMVAFSKEELQRALLNIKAKLYLYRASNSEPEKTNWDIFVENCEGCKRLI